MSRVQPSSERGTPLVTVQYSKTTGKEVQRHQLSELVYLEMTTLHSEKFDGSWKHLESDVFQVARLQLFQDVQLWRTTGGTENSTYFMES